MLEIILIIFLSKRIGKIAEEKGHTKIKYQVLFVVLWVAFEILGAFIGAGLSNGGTGTIYFFALLGAGLACLISFLIVNSLSEKNEIEDEINN